jgi:hypothetical protein
VLPNHRRAAVVQKLLTRLAQVGVHASGLYLDKGFCGGEVIRYLQKQRLAALLAGRLPGKQGGLRAWWRGRGS